MTEFVTPETRALMVRSSNEWMRRYIEEPERFDATFRTVQEFLSAEATGREPDYGEACTEYQLRLMAELVEKDAEVAS